MTEPQIDGWYPDPETSGQMRWYQDGSFTRHVLPVDAVPAERAIQREEEELHGWPEPHTSEPAPAPATKTAPAPGMSTWLVGIPAVVLLTVVGGANMSLAAALSGLLVLFTAVYVLVTGRQSWARISPRRAARTPLFMAVIVLVFSFILPTSAVSIPQAWAPLPSLSVQEQSDLMTKLGVIDPRMVTEWGPKKAVTLAGNVCRNDFVSQTPDQEIDTIIFRLTFSEPPQQLSPAQARATLEAVRASAFCGQPGDRPANAKAQMVTGLPAMWSLITGVFDGNHSEG